VSAPVTKIAAVAVHPSETTDAEATRVPFPYQTAPPAAQTPVLESITMDAPSRTPDAPPPFPPEVATAGLPPAPEPPGAAEIPNVTHVWQKWNNCGPSSVLMALSAHGVVLDQLEVAARMKPDREDTNVTPDEIARFARAQGFVAFAGLNGRTELLRALVSAGIPVIAEQWITVDGRGEMGHYRVVVGYDDAAGEVIVQDSYYGARRRHTYDGFAAEWRPFLGAYVAVARPDQQAALDAALGADIDQGAVVSNLRNQLESEAAGPGDAWTWYRLGEARSLAGDHEGAVGAYEEAIRIGLPTRAFWYQFGFYRSLLETGRAERALAHADATLATMSGENLEESQYWRGRALLALGRPADARASFERALLFNPLFEEARRALNGGG
jgi:hypothetical protein